MLACGVANSLSVLASPLFFWEVWVVDSGLGNGGRGKLPAELEGFSWAAFLWGGIWAVGHRVWIGLLAFVPLVGIIMNVVLGLRGAQWAWQSGAIEDVARYQKAQRTWVIVWIAMLGLLVPLTGVFSALAIVGVKKYIENAKAAEARGSLGLMAGNMKRCAEQGDLPESSDWVPAAPEAVKGMKYQSVPADWAAPAFACSGFTLSAPQSYRYRWVQATTASGQFEAQADLNGDGVVDSAFALGLHCTPAEGCVIEQMLGGNATP